MISYPPPYSREIWHYREANTDLFRRAINNFNWEKAFCNSTVTKKVSIFNETILNVLSNYIPHETLTCDDKDPPWFTLGLNLFYRIKISFTKSFEGVTPKQNYYARMPRKLSNVSKNCKAYWSLLRRLLNNKKLPLIPPLFHENKFLTDFKEKAEYFNSHFATQCSLISNISRPPSHIQYSTDNRLSCVSFSHDKIAKVIQNIDPNKAHGHDIISIRMLKVCGSEPLEIIFSQCLETGVFRSEWKKGKIVPVHKKGDKQKLKNYRPVSLLPGCKKILERLMFNEIWK